MLRIEAHDDALRGLTLMPRILDDQTRQTIAIGVIHPDGDDRAPQFRYETYDPTGATPLTPDGLVPGLALTVDEARQVWAVLDKVYGQEARVDRETLAEAIQSAEHAEAEAARYATRCEGLDETMEAVTGHVRALEQYVRFLEPLAFAWRDAAEQAMKPRYITGLDEKAETWTPSDEPSIVTPIRYSDRVTVKREDLGGLPPYYRQDVAVVPHEGKTGDPGRKAANLDAPVLECGNPAEHEAHGWTSTDGLESYWCAGDGQRE